MPSPHGGSGMPVALVAILVLVIVAGALYANRHRFMKYMGVPTTPDSGLQQNSTSETAEGAAPEQGAVAYPGFDPDQIYGPAPAPGAATTIDDTPTG